VFYVPARNQPLMRSTLPTSHGFRPLPTPGAPPISNPLPPGGESTFAENFAFVATIDASPYACVPAAIKYRRERLGGEREIARYMTALAGRGGGIVAGVLGTSVMENEERTLGKCAFANVALPLDARSLLALVPGRPGEDEAALERLGNEVMQWMQRVIVREHGTFMALNWHGGRWWVRLSAQVYLEEADFERAGEILKEVCGRVEKGEFLEGAAKL
jgi:hercynylcysteine S-oxide lyase